MRSVVHALHGPQSSPHYLSIYPLYGTFFVLLSDTTSQKVVREREGEKPLELGRFVSRSKSRLLRDIACHYVSAASPEGGNQ